MIFEAKWVTIRISLKKSRKLKEKEDEMEDLINQFKTMCNEASKMSNDEKIKFTKETIVDLDKLMASKDIKIQDYEKLMQIKRQLLSELIFSED